MDWVLRILLLVASLLLVWPYATYDYNFYFDQWHAVDRVLLLVLFAGLFWSPAFVLPLLGLVIPMAWQFRLPIGGFSWAAPDLSIHLLILFAGFYLVSLCTQNRKTDSFFFLACCMIAMHYWPSGLSKFRMGWFWSDPVSFLLPSTYANGWLSFLSAETIAGLTQVLGWLNPVLRLFTFVAECGCLVFLWRRSLAMGMLITWILFHTGVFLTTGICFWTWVVLEVCLLLLMWKSMPFRSEQFYGPRTGLLAFFLIASAPWSLNPVSLTWADARATYTYRFTGVGKSEKRYQLPPRFFALYDYPFTLGSFRYVSKEPVLPITWGSTGRALAERLKRTKTADELLALEAELARSSFNEKRVNRLETFIRTFVLGLNRFPARKHSLRAVHPPRLLWTFGKTDEYGYEEPIVRVEVVQVLSFFDGESYEEIRERPVLSIPIPLLDEIVHVRNQRAGVVSQK